MVGDLNRLVVCDLDGVVYLGETPVPGAGEALVAIEGAGDRVLFCTNNSWRTSAQVAARIERVVGYPATPAQVISSARVAADLVGEGPALVVGGDGIRGALTERGIEITEDPEKARAVVAGLDLEFSYRRLADATRAIREGARFVATNLDATYPTEQGLLPGAGSLVAALQTASGVTPMVAGKPFPPMREAIREAAAAREVWVVGDREDTDLEMAYLEGWRSVLVLTGVTRSPRQTPDFIVDSIADLPGVLAAG